MKFLIWILVAALVIMHQDFWNWDSSEIYLGFLPVGLTYHIGISLAASFVWAMACWLAWPKGVDEFENEPAPVTSAREGDKA
ncbi:MAG: DUF3311 domain-containing protein [Mariniblastus sp.]|nr:DUF3311 domain-containing protein [Mariniblastus sp.]